MKKGIILLFFTSLTIFGCNNEIQPYIPTLTPEQEKILEDFREAIRRNQITADSISTIYNTEYGYTIPIKVYLDRYSPMNYFLSDFEEFITDVPYYGLCNSDSTKGFIFSLHFSKNKIDVRIYRCMGEYSAYGDWYKYNVKF